MPRRSGEAKPLEEEQPPRQLLIRVLSTRKVRQANQHVRKRLVIWEKGSGAMEQTGTVGKKVHISKAARPLQRWGGRG